jgi:AcrR family transcriptional regulator
VGRKRTEARREEILRTAVSVVTERGFAHTRIVDVAESLGISTGLVFYHFESRDKLLTSAFLHVLERDVARLERVLARPWSPTRRLRGVIRLYDPIVSADGWILDIDSWAEGRRIPELGIASRTVERRFAHAIRDLVIEGVAAGEFVCSNPRHAAERIVSMLDGLAVGVHVRQRLSRSRATTWALQFTADELGLTVAQLTGKKDAGALSAMAPPDFVPLETDDVSEAEAGDVTAGSNDDDVDEDVLPLEDLGVGVRNVDTGEAGGTPISVSPGNGDGSV